MLRCKARKRGLTQFSSRIDIMMTKFFWEMTCRAESEKATQKNRLLCVVYNAGDMPYSSQHSHVFPIFDSECQLNREKIQYTAVDNCMI